MLYLIFYVLFAHLAGDFYLQTRLMVNAKTFHYGRAWGTGAHLIHAVIHGLLFCLALYGWSVISNALFLSGSAVFIHAFLIVLISHLLTDLLKSAIPTDRPSLDFSAFVIDQVIHIIILLWTVYGYLQQQIDIPQSLPLQPDATLIADFILLLCALAFLLRPSSLLVSKFLSMAMCDTKMDHINMTKSHLSEIFYESIRIKLGQLLAQSEILSAAKLNEVLIKSQFNNALVAEELRSRTPDTDVSRNFPSNQAGKWIGYIERVMIFLFFIVGQYAAIAAVMAIKTAFRFNDLKDDNDSHRSEYIMIGTFVSFFITMMTAVVVRQILVGHEFSHAAIQLLSNLL